LVYSEFQVVAETNDFHIPNEELYNYLSQARFIWNHYCFTLEVVPFVVNSNISFKKEAFNGDKLVIRTCLVKIGNTSFTLQQSMFNEKNELVVSAETVLTTMDLKTRTKVRVPDSLRELLHKDIPLAL
jgi:thioesterase III